MPSPCPPRDRRPARSAVAALGLLLAACAARSTASTVAPVAAGASAPASGAPAASVAPVGSAGRDDGWAGLQPARDAAEAGRCTAAQLAAARAEARSVARQVDALPANLSVAAAVGESVVRLLGSPCHGGQSLLFGLEPDALRSARAWGLRRWWQDGGQDIVEGPLDRANALRIAPSVPTVIGAETLPAGSPLRAIVCPTSDAVCDPLAEGAVLDLGREVERVSGQEPRRGPPDDPTDCIRASHGKDRLLDALSCLYTSRWPRPGLPVARYRSPRGWLVLRGRRGHHAFCDESRAYDLASGAAYIASRCVDRLASARPGARGPAVTTQTGVVSVDALRRLALMLHLRDSLVDEIWPFGEVLLPEGVPLPAPGSSLGMGFGSGRGAWAHSGQTIISFAFLDGGSFLHTGKFQWPDSAELGDQIIDDLVVSTETTLRPGCPPAPLPAALARVPALGGVSRLDAAPGSLHDSADELTAALATLRTTPVCRQP